MSVKSMTEPVAVWLDSSGRPVRLVWKGTRYTVSDTPTPLRGEEPDLEPLLEAVTYPLLRLVGWRFQATSSTGDTFVVDVRRGDREQWELIGVYS